MKYNAFDEEAQTVAACSNKMGRVSARASLYLSFYLSFVSQLGSTHLTSYNQALCSVKLIRSFRIMFFFIL